MSTNTISKFDNTTGCGVINSRYDTSVQLYTCQGVHMHEFNKIAAAIKIAEEEAVKYAKFRIASKVNDAIEAA